MRKPLPYLVRGALAVSLACAALAACGHAAGNGQAAAAASSFAANPTTSADVAQAKALVASCLPATPVQQLKTLDLVFLHSATGKDGAQVTAARNKLSSCLGIPPAQRPAFENAAITAAEHGHLTKSAGRKTYAEVTLPALVIRYKGMSTASASPGSGTIPVATSSPAKAGASS
jgi:hypothetical protein